MSKFTLIGGGILSGTGIITGTTGLAVMGVNESESDLIRKKNEIDDEKMKLNKEIMELEQRKVALTEKLNNKTNRENAAQDIQTRLDNKVNEIVNKLNSEECWELELNSIVGQDNILKDEEWLKGLLTDKVETGCDKNGEWYIKPETTTHQTTGQKFTITIRK